MGMSKYIDRISGIDEAGRGAFAGPIMMACVTIADVSEITAQLASLPVRDSKTLSELQREKVYDAICKLNIPFDIECINVPEINLRGIGWANIEGIRSLIQRSLNVSTGVPHFIVDGYFPAKKIAVPGADIVCQVDADATELPVILAGIVAKVSRDRIMKQLHKEFIVYGWERNKGYGTREHREAIRKHGMCIYHREQFVATSLKSSP